MIAALRRNTWIDYLCTGYTVLGFAVPNFGLALILIYVFSIKLDWCRSRVSARLRRRRAACGRI